jgi:hypothetical protein
MSNNTCNKCKWFSEIGHAPGGEATGECRIGRPLAIEGYSSCAWPQPRAIDWCGEFAPRDNRVNLLETGYMQGEPYKPTVIGRIKPGDAA